jgi:hypothetical protein
MSIQQNEPVVCPNCKNIITIETYQSLNPNRQTDVTPAILNDTLQSGTCPCGKQIRIEPHMMYMDIKNGLFMAVFPSSEIENFKQHEMETATTFDDTLKSFPDAPKAKKRIVFGWPALKEKVLAQEHGISDIELEMVKMAIIRTGADQIPFQTTCLRLVDINESDLVFDCVQYTPPYSVEVSFEYPKNALTHIQTYPEDWASLRKQIDQGLFIDLYAQFY